MDKLLRNFRYFCLNISFHILRQSIHDKKNYIHSVNVHVFTCTKGRIPTKGRNLVRTRNRRITGITWISVFKIATFFAHILIY